MAKRPVSRSRSFRALTVLIPVLLLLTALVLLRRDAAGPAPSSGEAGPARRAQTDPKPTFQTVMEELS